MSHRRHLSPMSDPNRSGATSGPSSGESGGAYPLPAYLNFTPGGVLYQRQTSNSSQDHRSRPFSAQQRSRGGRSVSNNAPSDHFVHLSQYSTQPNSQQQSPTSSPPTTGPEAIVHRALRADAALRKYALLYARHDWEEKRRSSNLEDDGKENNADDGDNKSIEMEDASPNNEEQNFDPKNVPHYLPSLSVLAEKAFGPITGVPANSARWWADAMVLSYLDNEDEDDNDDEIAKQDVSMGEQWETPRKKVAAANPNRRADLVSTLKHLHDVAQKSSPMSPHLTRTGRPCGYVFRRGDIAWNCRTCQTDSTCVLCDRCFHESDHEGHEVFFHRTSPGGCCDCGDAEAWRVEGCCERHRPRIVSSESGDGLPQTGSGSIDIGGEGDDFEAVRVSLRGRADGEEAVRTLPPRFAAALGVVIGNAVQATVRALDGSGIGADPCQWRLRWADQMCRIHHGAADDEDYFLCMPTSEEGSLGAESKKMTPQSLLEMSDAAARSTLSSSSMSPRASASSSGVDAAVSTRSASPTPPPPQPPMPSRFRLQLRLHNDDVHTFDEVIEALHDQSYIRRHPFPNGETETSAGLVFSRDDADDMTHHVDSDGQVTVRSYVTFAGAKAGYERLKGRGLHCAVVSQPQVDLELRVKCLLSWLADVGAAHPGAAALVVHALVDVTEGEDMFGGVNVWDGARTIPSWCGSALDPDKDGAEDEFLRKRFSAFPPHLTSSYLTREESERLFRIAFESGSYDSNDFAFSTGADPNFYSNVPYSLPSERYRKSPHALWGTMPISNRVSQPSLHLIHPILAKLKSQHSTRVGNKNINGRSTLREGMLLIDTDLRKQQEADRLTGSMFPHKLSGLHLISGVGLVQGSGSGSGGNGSSVAGKSPNAEEWRHLLATSSFRAPVSPLVLLLLLDPYPSKQLRSAVHKLFLSLLVDSRFKSRFAASLGGVAYRPISTLFCAGVGTDADTPLGFTVQIFTAGSLVRALGNVEATKRLLTCDAGREDGDNVDTVNSIDVFTIPIAQTVVRCIHTNLLGATKEVTMVLKNTAGSNMGESNDENGGNFASEISRNDAGLPSLTYQPGEHPLTTPLPAAPDDGFLDSRSTKHRRLPHLLRDLEYIFETPGTAMRLLMPPPSPMRVTNIPQSIVESYGPQSPLTFPTIWSRLLRLAQGMDPQKRKISGGHIEYENQRWLEAFGLSINIAGTRDALAESPSNSAPNTSAPPSLRPMREAVGNLFVALLREIKLWLYREGLLDTGFLLPASSSALGELSQLEALQRSTLHVSSSQIAASLPSTSSETNAGVAHSCQLSCATGVKMTEAQLALIESALRYELAQHEGRAAIMGDWLRVPHSPLQGESISFHLPLHRALARSIRSICSVVVPDEYRTSDPGGWWKLPVLDDDVPAFPRGANSDPGSMILQHPLCALLRPTLRSSNCRVVWSAGPDCSTPEAQLRRSRSRAVGAAIASAKIVHSLCDHPLRCLAASQQIERHLWARNGSSATGMALNYGSAPLCRSFRDLDLALVQLSASGLSIGLGARRVFSLLISRFSMDGYLCDPERRGVPNSVTSSSAGGSSSPTAGGAFGGGSSGWVNPPRLNDPDYAVVLSEAFFTTLCLIVTELPSAPPLSTFDDSALRRNMRRELLHALAAEPRSHSEAMAAASGAATRRDESDGSSGGSGGASSFYSVFVDVLKDVGRQKNQGSKTGPPTYELKPACSDEYDPTFFHLRRTEHQHAMDNIARLRRLKISSGGKDSKKCLPLVSAPPLAHPRFMPCRLLLHLAPMDAAIRRMLLFALTDGQWLPPPEPEPEESSIDDNDDPFSDPRSETTGSIGSSGAPVQISLQAKLGRRTPSRSTKRPTSPSAPTPFSPAIVAASSKSFLEVLQILTLQVHTLEECASLHRTQPCLDEESKSLSASLSINSYLGRLINVPASLVDVWSLRCYPDGPLPSKGSGANRGSILGLLIALYEHRSDHGNCSGSATDSGHGDDGHGGARALTADGLKWLLRFVNSLVDGASSVSAACQSATNGVPVRSSAKIGSGTATVGGSGASAPWTINPSICDGIRGMLRDLPDLWPKEEDNSIKPGESSASGTGGLSAKNREARKAAQKRALERMKKQQASFAASIAAFETKNNSDGGGKNKGLNDDPDDEEADLCIICRCDDADGENNGPLGYLGHVQRSRALQLRSVAEMGARGGVDPQDDLHKTYRVVGDRGCQLRATEAMDSEPVACLPMGSVVTILQSKVSPKYDLLSRRVLVRHIKPKATIGNDTRDAKVTEGWASVQSSQGYVILSPLSSLCFTNSRWGSTRPIIRQCGHAAHLQCVEKHCLSLHHRAAGDQPYDGRFAANIDDGEFLCPLCKQLSNVLVPKDRIQESKETISRMNSQTSADSSSAFSSMSGEDTIKNETVTLPPPGGMSSIRNILCTPSTIEYTQEGTEMDKERNATKQFGGNLLQAMQIPWDNTKDAKMKQQKKWHPALRRWNFEEEDGDDILPGIPTSDPLIGNILRLFRQQHIAWAAVGHTTAAVEASSRSILQFGDYVTSDPWTDYRKDSRDSHPMLLELRRTIAATSSHLEVLSYELGQQLGTKEAKSRCESTTIIGRLLGDILDGSFWSVGNPTSNLSSDYLGQWRIITALLSAMPCHVSKDGMLSQRHEARATAAAMWAVKGIGYSPKHKASLAQSVTPDESTQAQYASASSDLLLSSSSAIDDSQKKGIPSDPITSTQTTILPTPFCIQAMFSSRDASLQNDDFSGSKDLKASWGSMDPFKVSQSDLAEQESASKNPTPFRPGVASAFLYVPLLAWDMNTLAGAVFSSLLSNRDTNQPTRSDDLLFASHTLLLGRLVQVLITPNGFDPLHSSTAGAPHEDEEEMVWSEEELNRERISLNNLLTYCRKLVNHPSNSTKELDSSIDLMRAVGYAVLPFARTLILLLRVSASTLRQKQRRERSKKAEKPSLSDKRLESILLNADIMTYDDGFKILYALGGPMPSKLFATNSSFSWNSLIGRWIASLNGFESYHGSQGSGLVFDGVSGTWVSAEDNKFSEIDALQAIGKARSYIQGDGTQQHSFQSLTPKNKQIDSETNLSNSSNGMMNGEEGLINGPVGSNDASIDMQDAEDSSVDENDDNYSNDDYEEMEEDETSEVQGIFWDRHGEIVVDDDVGLEDEDPDEMEMDADAAEETIDFDEALDEGFGATRHTGDAEAKDDSDDASDDNSSTNSSGSCVDRDYAYVSRSAIVPYQPSLLGGKKISPGPRGAKFDYNRACDVMSDLSHLGMVHRPDSPAIGLIRLPQSFVELYSLVNRVKGRDIAGGMDEADDGSSSETAICLLTGSIMRSGSSRRSYSRSNRPPGNCTMHARKIGSGVGIFFLVQKCTVLLMHNNKSAYSPSLYVDEHGEEDPGLRRGRPLFLKSERFQSLEMLWRQHGIPREVAQIRSTSDRVIRDNWY